MENNNRLNELFKQAREQQPKASFEETKMNFLQALDTANTAKTKSKGGSNLFNLKFFTIMLVSITAIITTVMLLLNNNANTPKQQVETSTELIKNIITLKSEDLSENTLNTNTEPRLMPILSTELPQFLINIDSALLVKRITDYSVHFDTFTNKNNVKQVIIDSTYVFPVLTPDEIEDNNKQKRKMLKQLAKFDKDKYAYIPSGTFNTNNKVISVQAFYMQTTEVTVLEYRTFLFDLLIQNRKKDFLMAKPDQTQWLKTMGENAKPLKDHYFSHSAYNNYPVNNISREGALMYCRWLNEELNKSDLLKKNEIINDVRLPSNYEWMYAASEGGKQKPYPWGGPYVRNAKGCYLANFKPGKDTSLTCDSWNKLKDVKDGDSLVQFIKTMDDARLPIFNNNPYSDDGGLYTVNVNSYAPNDFGLYCISGNIAEMVIDDESKQPMTKGGSWMSPMHELQINTEGIHKGETGPMLDVGFRVVITYLQNDKSKTPIGTINVGNGLYCDVTEVTNFNWKEYINWLDKKYGKSSSEYVEMLPDTNVWVDKLGSFGESYMKYYYNHPAYNEYPVVGISYKQAKAYCVWRSDRVNELNNTSIVEYRLPSREEWERIASIDFDGTMKRTDKKYEGMFKYNLKRDTADYLGVADEMIDNADVTAPVKSYWPNTYGAYNMIGNVAEMTTIEGVAKGGSWIDNMNEISIEKNNIYSKPECWLGFRCVATIIE